MSFLGKKCPRCGAFAVPGMRFCGRCGYDLEAQETSGKSNDIESIRPVRPSREAGAEVRPRPTMTARYAAPEPERREERYEARYEERQPVERQPIERQPIERQPIERQPIERQPVDRQPVDRRTARWGDRRDIWKLAAVIAGALVLLVLVIVLIARANRKDPAPPVSEPIDEVHVIAALTPEPSAPATPTPSPSPTPTPPPSTPEPTATPLPISEVYGVVYAMPAVLEIRSGPGIEYDAILTVPYGTALNRTGLMDGWTRIVIDGREGYVPNTQISMEKPEPTPTPTPLALPNVEPRDDTVVVESGANLRIGPGTQYDVVTTAGGGRELHRTGVYGDWSRVEYDGYGVFVYTELLITNDEPAETSAPATPAPAAPEATPESVSFAGTVTMRMNGNVRTGPGTEYDSLGLAMGGDVLEASALENGWYKVSFQGQTGYVLASLAEPN